MPFKYTDDQIQTYKDKIILELSKGRSLLATLKKFKELPSRPTIYLWLNPESDLFDETFSNNYIRAREDSADENAERIEEIAEKTLKGKFDPSAARVAMDALKWAAAVKKPKKYGKRVDVTTAGKELPQQITVFKLPDNDRDSVED